mgnify:CR=1 FL=1
MRRFLVPLLSLTMLANAPAAQAEPTAERGAYLARIMDCGGCHTTGALIGRPDPARRAEPPFAHSLQGQAPQR